jgi:hypothetical protein
MSDPTPRAANLQAYADALAAAATTTDATATAAKLHAAVTAAGADVLPDPNTPPTVVLQAPGGDLFTLTVADDATLTAVPA